MSLSATVRSLVAALLFALTVAPAPAETASASSSAATAWSPGGTAIAAADTDQFFPVIAPDALGGAFVVWSDDRASFQWQPNPYAQHIDYTGHVASGWSASGMPLPSAHLENQVAIPDGSGGTFMAVGGSDWYEHIVVYHFGPTGQPVAGWPVGGAAIQLLSGGEPQLAATGRVAPANNEGAGPGDILPDLALDDAGGVLVSFNHIGKSTFLVHVTRLTSTGALASGWPWNGAMFSAGYEGQFPSVICSDAAGGAFVAWTDEAAGIIAGHVLSSGTIDARWPIGGRVLADAVGPANSPGICADGAGGCLVVWEQRDAGGAAHPTVLRLNADGTTATGWTAHGLALSASMTAPGSLRQYSGATLTYSSMAPDAAGGVYVAWTDLSHGAGDVFVQHVTSGGLIAAGWPSGALALAAGVADERLPSIARDEMGGALIAWQSTSASDSGAFVQHVTAAGAPAPGWSNAGVRVDAGHATHPVVASDAAGGALVAWEDRHGRAPNVFMQRVAVAPTAALPEPASLRLEPVRPNPLAGDLVVAFSIRSGSPGRLEVFDVGGRRVRHSEVAAGGGRRTVNLGQGLGPGMYFIRLSQDRSAVEARAVILD